MKKPIVLAGKSGSGKTRLAKLIAHSSNHVSMVLAPTLLKAQDLSVFKNEFVIVEECSGPSQIIALRDILTKADAKACVFTTQYEITPNALIGFDVFILTPKN